MSHDDKTPGLLWERSYDTDPLGEKRDAVTELLIIEPGALAATGVSELVEGWGWEVERPDKRR